MLPEACYAESNALKTSLVIALSRPRRKETVFLTNNQVKRAHNITSLC